MTTTGWIIAGIAAYFLFFSAPRRPTSTAPAPQPVATVSGGATRITIPGVGEYVNVAGGQSVAITLDPNFISAFGG